MQNQNHTVVLYYERSLRSIEGNYDRNRTFRSEPFRSGSFRSRDIPVWPFRSWDISVHKQLITFAYFNDYRQAKCRSSWCYTGYATFRSGRSGLGRFGLGRFGLGRFGLGTFQSDYEILQKSYMFTF